MKMNEAGIELASTELWKAIQQIMKKATGNKTSQNKYVIPTKTYINVKIGNKTKYFPLCIITGDYDTQIPNSLLSKIYGGLKHFSAHFNNIKKLLNKNYRNPNTITSQASFDSFCLATRELNNILNDKSRMQSEVQFIKDKKGNAIKAIIEPTILCGDDELTFRFVIRLPIIKKEIAYVHTCYPLQTNTYDRKKKSNNS